MSTPMLYLTPSHPLARVAVSHCEGHTAPLIGGVACGPCWELAIRDDERFAVQEGLPRQIASDPTLVDQVAVDRAIRGESIELTTAERSWAIGHLRAKGSTLVEIARLLRVGHHTVCRELQILNRSNRSLDATGAA